MYSTELDQGVEGYKVLIVSSGDFFSDYGGGQIYVKNLVFGLVEAGQEPTVLSVTMKRNIREIEIDKREYSGVWVWQIIVPSVYSKRSFPLELADDVCIAFENIVTSIGPSVIHANGWKAMASSVAERVGIPCIITAHHGGIVCPNGLLMNKADQLCKVSVSEKNCLDCELAFTLGGRPFRPLLKNISQSSRLAVGKALKRVPTIPYVTQPLSVPLGIFHKELQILAMQKAKVVIAPSRAIASALIRNGFTEGQVRVLPHGISPMEIRPLRAGYPGRPLRLGYIGRINYIKGLHLIFSALRRLPQPEAVEFHVYGEAVTKAEKSYLKRLQAMARGLNVSWHGRVPHDRIDAAYRDVDVVVLASICTEIFGLTLLEAFSSGRPVIASRCGGPEDIVTDGIDGFLVPTNDSDALANAINKLLDDPILLASMVSEIKPINTLRSHVNALLEIYGEFMAPMKARGDA